MPNKHDGRETRNNRPAPAAPSISPELDAEGSETRKDPSAADMLKAALMALLSDDTGWLRAVPADGGDTIYLKWKWTSGKLSNRYVMAVGEVQEMGHLFMVLLAKKFDAEVGTGRTTPDKWHDAQ